MQKWHNIFKPFVNNKFYKLILYSKKNMKICMIIEAWYPIYGGGQTYALELCRWFIKKYNCEIELYTRSLNFQGQSYTQNESLFEGKLKIIRCGITSAYENPIGRISWVFSVTAKNLFKKINLIHGHANLGGLPTKILSILKRIPSIFTVQGSGLLVWDQLKPGVIGKFNRQVEKTLQTRIKYSKEISVDSLFASFPNVNKNIKVIPNGVDIKKFDNISSEKETKFLKGLFVGRLHPQKGLTYLLEALKLIKDKINMEIHIIGSGELDSELKEKVKSYNLENIVIFRGKKFDDELIKEYKSSHFFILPSVFEGQPLTILEAWASSLPTLVTDCGENKKFINEDENGWIVPIKDSQALADKIVLVNNTSNEKLIEMGKIAYGNVKQYDWENITDRTYEVYQEVLKQ